MSLTNSQLLQFENTLDAFAPHYGVAITADDIARLSGYYKLVEKWNPKLHLVAPCSPREFASRHILESLLLVNHLPRSATVADVGSGAGLPIIPCLMARPDIRATLIESSKKKAIFLREALNRVSIASSAEVIAQRFEEIKAPDVEFITCRALERFKQTLPTLIEWAPPASSLLLFGGQSLREAIGKADPNFKEIKIPNSERRFLFVVKRR